MAVVGQGPSAFKVVEYRAEPGRTFDDVAKWLPYPWLRSLGPLVHSGLNWLLSLGRTASEAPDAAGMAPRTIVAEAFVRRLQAAGSFEGVEAVTAEPVGDDRRGLDGIVRVSVPTWGFIRVRENPDLLSTFADVHAQMVIPETGVVVWETREDATDPERFPWESVAGDRRLARQQLREVLEQAGQRLASEFLYARGAAR